MYRQEHKGYAPLIRPRGYRGTRGNRHIGLSPVRCNPHIPVAPSHPLFSPNGQRELYQTVTTSSHGCYSRPRAASDSPKASRVHSSTKRSRLFSSSKYFFEDFFPKTRKTLAFPFWDGFDFSTFGPLSCVSEALKHVFSTTSVPVF